MFVITFVQIIPYDARNHGDSDHRPDMSYSVMANDLVGLCQDLGLDSPVVLGHSMGGKSAMTAALTKVSILYEGDLEKTIGVIVRLIIK